MGPELPISVMAAQLGVEPATLRAWQRRYGLGASARSPGGHRRYTRQDMHRLRGMRELMAAGLNPAEAARVVLAEADGNQISARSSGRDDTAPNLDPDRLRQAALALNGSETSDLLRRGLASHGSCLTWEQLVRPALRAVDSCKMSQAYRIAAEHLLSYFVSATFVAHASRFALDEPSPGRGSVLLACAPAEQHSLPLTALGATLAEARIGVDVLGARTPTPALAAAVAATAPSVVLVLALHAPAAEPLVFDQPPRDITWIAAGSGWANQTMPHGVNLVDGLGPAVRLIQATQTDRVRR